MFSVKTDARFSIGVVDATEKNAAKPPLFGADGGWSPRKPDRAQPSRKVVAHTGTLTCERPPRLRRLRRLRGIFLMAQPPLLTRRGLGAFQWTRRLRSSSQFRVMRICL